MSCLFPTSLWGWPAVACWVEWEVGLGRTMTIVKRRQPGPSECTASVEGPGPSTEPKAFDSPTGAKATGAHLYDGA